MAVWLFSEPIVGPELSAMRGVKTTMAATKVLLITIAPFRKT